MNKEEDIFDLSIAKEEGKFIKQGLLLESDVASVVIDTLYDFPWFGSLIKLGRLGKSILDHHFIRNIAIFLKPSADMEVEKKESFLSKLDMKDRKKIVSILINQVKVSRIL